jgi:hypothetical protein
MSRYAPRTKLTGGTGANLINKWYGNQFVAVRGSRGLIFGGYYAASPNYSNTIQYNTIASTGNYTSFGTLAANTYVGGAGASSTRGIYTSGFAGTYPASTAIQYVTIATTGNAVSFGSYGGGAVFNISQCSNDTRAVFAGGYDNGGGGYLSTSHYVTIATTGNSTSFGSLFRGQTIYGGGNSTTRGVNFGGDIGGCGNYTNSIYYITIATTGNWQSFGTLSQVLTTATGLSSSTRVVIAQGQYHACTSPYYTSNMEYITTATAGNGTSFGTLSRIGTQAAGVDNGVLGNIVAGYTTSGSALSDATIQITIASTGNGTTVSGLTMMALTGSVGTSNCHGGLA